MSIWVDWRKMFGRATYDPMSDEYNINGTAVRREELERDPELARNLLADKLTHMAAMTSGQALQNALQNQIGQGVGSSGILPGGGLVGQPGFVQQQMQAQQQAAKARAEADYERAMQIRKKITNVSITQAENGWIVEIEGQHPWVCTDLDQIGDTIAKAMATKVLEGGTK